MKAGIPVTRPLNIDRLLLALIAIAAIAVLTIRLWIMSDLPLWLDETWTGMIVTQPDWPSFWREVLLDVNAPLYYVVMKLWVGVFGDSNFALRLPSLLFACAAALAPVIWRHRELSTAGAWTWAALLFLWTPGIFVSIDARAYALLLLLGVLSSLGFARLYERLELRGAALWVTLCSLMFLTHYFAAVLIAAQALVLLVRHRMAIVQIWPTSLIGLPALTWFAFHFPRLQDYVRPDVAWYERTDLAAAAQYAKYVVGPPSSTFLPLIAAILCYGWLISRQPAGSEGIAEPKPPRGLQAAAWAGLIGLVLALALGMVRASLTDRYLISLVPSILLGVALLAQHSRKRALISLLLVAVSALPSLNVLNLKREAQSRNAYGYEQASAFLAKYRPTDLVFSWDHPNAKILDRGSLADLGGFFLARSGSAVRTNSVLLDPADDPNIVLADHTTGPRPAIIWIYNTRRVSAAREHPPALDLDPRWDCWSASRPSGRGARLGTLACVEKEPGHV